MQSSLLPLPRNPAEGRTNFPSPAFVGEGGPKGRMREEIARFRGPIRDHGVVGDAHPTGFV